MILSENSSDEKIFLFFSLFDNSIPDLVHLSGLRRFAQRRAVKEKGSPTVSNPEPTRRG
jgi:hypothetical protein